MIVISSDPAQDTMPSRKPPALLSLVAVLIGFGSCPVMARVMKENAYSAGPVGAFLLLMVACAVVTALAFVLLLRLRDGLKAMMRPASVVPQAPLPMTPSRKPSALLAFVAALIGFGSCPVTARVMMNHQNVSSTIGPALYLLLMASCAVVTALAFVLLLRLRDGLKAMVRPASVEPEAQLSDHQSTRSRPSGAALVLAFVVGFAAIGAGLNSIGVPETASTVERIFRGPVEGAIIGGVFGLPVAWIIAALVSLVLRPFQKH